MNGQGWRPERNPHTFLAALLTIGLWLVGITCGVAAFLNLVK